MGRMLDPMAGEGNDQPPSRQGASRDAGGAPRGA
jgi:hypothetical protein